MESELVDLDHEVPLSKLFIEKTHAFRLLTKLMVIKGLAVHPLLSEQELRLLCMVIIEAFKDLRDFVLQVSNVLIDGLIIQSSSS